MFVLHLVYTGHRNVVMVTAFILMKFEVYRKLDNALVLIDSVEIDREFEKICV